MSRRRSDSPSPSNKPGFPELGLLVSALLLAGLQAGGTPRQVFFGLAWLLVMVACLEVLPALLALTVSVAAIAGLFGIDPEGSLTFIGIALGAAAAAAATVAALVGCAALLRYLWGRRPRLPRGASRRRGGRGAIPGPRSPASAPIGGQRLLSLSQCIVSLAVRRLPATMSDEERERWEEEMRGDVEGRFPFLRSIYAVAIWVRGASGMPDGTEDAAQNRPSRG